MGGEGMKRVAGFILLLNLCMYTIICATAGWALDRAIEHEIMTGLDIPYWAIYFPMGNAATGFFIIFGLIAGVVGAASCISAIIHLLLRSAWTRDSLASAASAAFTPWALTLLAMGLACKEIHLHGRNSRLKTVESFVIIVSGTQALYILLIHIAITKII